MRHEALLAGTAGVVVVALALAAALAPGIAATPGDDRVRPSRTEVRDTAFAASRVGGETVSLTVTTLLGHRGGPAANVTVAYRMVDADTGLVVDRARRQLGDVQGDREVETNATLTVERDGGYRLYTYLYEDGKRVDTAQSSIEGTGSLVPAYADSPVDFHQFGGAQAIPAVQYAIESVSNGDATVRVTAYLTNGGDEPAADLEVQLIARQADSNVIADSARVDIGEIRPGRSATPSAELTVADNYTYYLDAVLWRDGVIVGSARAVADLNPRRQQAPNTTAVDLDANDFAADTETPEERVETDEPRAEATATESGGQPGFGLVAAVIAASLVGLLARRWSA